MTRVGIAGDWHGNARWAVSCLDWFSRQGIEEVYQVGDFGIWPGPDGEAYLQYIIAACKDYGIRLLIIPGNHEDYSQIADPDDDTGVVPPKQVLADGDGWEVTILPRGWQWEIDGKRFLAFGGAPSVDRSARKKDVDWWAEEAIRENDLLRLSKQDGVDVMLCHDSPDGGTPSVQAIIEKPWDQSFFDNKDLAYAAEGRELMNKAVEEVDPRWFIHGHFHVADHRYDYPTDRHYVSMHTDGMENNVGILSWNEDEDDGVEVGMTFDFFGGDSWIKGK